MPRRVIYDPAQFIEASTPFFENVVGTITDQADRISRNLARSREQRAIAEERAFQVGLLQQRQGFQAQMQEDTQQFQGELQEDQQSFQNEQDRMQMKMEDMQFQEMMEYRWAGLQQKGWLDFMQMEQKRGTAMQDILDDYEKRANEYLKKIKKLGPTGSAFPQYFSVTANEDGEIFVGQDGWGVMRWDNFISENSPVSLLTDLADLTGGQTIEEFSKKLYDAEENFAVQGVTRNGQPVTRQGEDTLISGEGVFGIGADTFRKLGYSALNGTIEPGEVETLRRLASNDAQYQLVYKDNPKAERWDQRRVSSVVGSAKEALGMMQSHTGGLITTAGERNVDEQKYVEMFPNLIEVRDPINPEQSIPAKTIGNARQAVINQFVMFTDNEDYNIDSNPLFKSQFQATEGIYNLARETFMEYGDSMAIPEALKNKSPEFLASISRINEQEFNKANPDPTRLFTLPSDESQVNDLAKMDEFDLYSEVGAFTEYQDKQEAKRRAQMKLREFHKNFSMKGNYIGN